MDIAIGIVVGLILLAGVFFLSIRAGDKPQRRAGDGADFVGTDVSWNSEISGSSQDSPSHHDGL